MTNHEEQFMSQTLSGLEYPSEESQPDGGPLPARLALGLGKEDLGRLLAAWSRRSPLRSFLKVTFYFASVAALMALIVSLDSWLAILFCQAMLGLVYAHGLELVHECLHHNMFRSPFYNRLFGVLAGIPLLVSYSHYKYQHLHHHRYVGSDKDKEIFDYEEKSLLNPLTFFSRAWNLMRIPTFFGVLLSMLCGRYSEAFATPRSRREVLSEYILLTTLLLSAFVLTLFQYTDFFLLAWFMPWLLFGEAFHFFIELPEHLGRDRTSKEVSVNTRSYRCSKLFSYIINANNYHVEHHLYPHVAVHNLRLLNEQLNSRIHHTIPSYWSALKEAFEGSTQSHGVCQKTDHL